MSRSTHPRPRGRRAAVMRRYPQGSVRGTELSLDEKGQSASSGSSRRLRPAAPAVVAGLRYSGPLAHQRDRVAVLLAVNGLVLPSHFCSLAKYAAAFFRNSFSILALRSSARSLLISADSLRSSSSFRAVE